MFYETSGHHSKNSSPSTSFVDVRSAACGEKYISSVIPTMKQEATATGYIICIKSTSTLQNVL